MNVFEALRLEKSAARKFIITDGDMPFETQSAQRLYNDVPVVPGNYLPSAAVAAATAGTLKFKPLSSINQLRLVRREGADGPVSSALAIAAGLYAGKKTRDMLNAREGAGRDNER